MTEPKPPNAPDSEAPEKEFDHADFWNSYSRSWEDRVGPRIGGGILGEEWAPPEHTRFIFERFAEPYLHPEATVVEIGPGGGKFSRLLVDRCRELFLVDISREMIQRANAACAGKAKELLVRDGQLDSLENESIDLVFSYDVFIHLEAEEVFRYFAEVNRALKKGGTFSVHSSTYESRWGFHSFLQQLRDNHPRIGQRYGGRMYPLTSAIVRRFAEHSGFEEIDHHSGPDDKDIIFALRKVRPARPWHLLSRPELAREIELSERIGGSDERELYALRDLQTGALGLGLIGDSTHPELQATANAELPEHSCLPKPLRFVSGAGQAIVVFGDLRGDRIQVKTPAPAGWRRLEDRLAQLVQGVLLAHERGLAHGEISTRTVIEERASGICKLFGFYAPPDDSKPSRQEKDLRDLGSLLGAMLPLEHSPNLGKALGELVASPTSRLALQVASILSQ